MGGSKQVSRALGGCALTVVAFAVPAHGADVNVVGDVVEQAAQSLPPVQLPLPAPGPAPADPAPVAPAPAAAPSAPALSAAPAAPAPSTTVQPKAASATGSRAAARGSGGGRRATAAAAAERADRGQPARDAGEVAIAAQVGGAASETADPEATGAQPAGDPDGALPFTGFQVVVVALLGLLALGAGFELRRATGRQPRTSRAGA